MHGKTTIKIVKYLAGSIPVEHDVLFQHSSAGTQRNP
jgi:hypothetical protein